MTDTYLASAVQYEPAFSQKKENLRALAALTGQAAGAGARLVVLPEMAATGCMFRDAGELGPVAETIPGPTTEFLGGLARRWGIYLVVGLPEVEPSTGALYNACALLGPTGNLLAKYRKTHLFHAETHWCSPGNLPVPVIDTEIGSLSMMICMDAEFFEVARVAALRGAGVMALPANWVGPAPAKSWRARALENGIYLVVADRWGTEGGIAFRGNTCLVGPEGEVLDSLETGDGVVTARVDLKRARDKSLEGLGDRLRLRRPGVYQGLLLNPYLWHRVQGGGRRGAFAVVQSCPGHDWRANLERLARLARQALEGHRGILVFPEYCLSQWPVDPEQALPVPGPQVDALEVLARELGSYLVAGLLERDGTRRYSTTVLVGPEGVAGFYRKVHLSGEERAWASPGESLSGTHQTPYGRVALLGGTDLLFPEAPRSAAKNRADLLAVPAAWTRREHDFLWDDRWATNDLFLGVANRCGAPFSGRSTVYGNPWETQGPNRQRCAPAQEGFAVMDVEVSGDTPAGSKDFLRMQQVIWYERIALREGVG
ncbi:MAG: nitrilase-related carbon-nitrogen hydrolase [Bacillota bacterium]